MKIITWNIDGLNDDNLSDRTHIICGCLLSAAPDVILLQEVTHDTLPYIQTILTSSGYIATEQNAPEAPYFCVGYIRSNVKLNAFNRKKFQSPLAQSRMFRDMIVISAKCTGCKDVLIVCSHLESCKESSPQRVAQLEECLSMLAENDGPAFLAGDLNMRDSEAKAAINKVSAHHGRKNCIADCWVDAGSSQQTKITWHLPGSTHIKARFDRVYHNKFENVEVCSFELIAGTDDVSGEVLSDHSAIVLEVGLPQCNVAERPRCLESKSEDTLGHSEEQANDGTMRRVNESKRAAEATSNISHEAKRAKMLNAALSRFHSESNQLSSTVSPTEKEKDKVHDLTKM